MQLERVRKVLLIDDDEDDRFFFQKAVEDLNKAIECHLAHDSRTGMDKLNPSSALPDIIFLDINMPNINGKEILAMIKKSTAAHIPVVIYSASNNPLHISEANALGAIHYIVKPYRISDIRDQLLSAIRMIEEPGERLSAN